MVGEDEDSFDSSNKLITSHYLFYVEIDISKDQRWFKDDMSEDDIDQLQLSEEHH